MQFSILHLSDLHRDLSNEIATPTLLDSVERDLERQAVEKPKIPSPSLCAVTGDMVFGAARNGPSDELARQYSQTHDFLVGIADRFFDGVRERVVILPGNHDVSLPTFHACTQRVDVPPEPAEKKKLVDEYFKPTTQLRWSWSELCFYRIVDEALYSRRFEPFAALYADFYQGKRSFSHEPELQHDAFDFPALGFSVLTLSSCYRNDPLRRAGAFSPVAVSNLCKAARSPERAGWLIAAAWHHSVSGGPMQDDYLDSSVLQHFIDAGVSLALHGHQHSPDCVDERYRVGSVDRKITIVSAGTLCAGPHHLPTGQTQSFNVVELDTDNLRGRVHHRKMVGTDLTLPLWGPGHFDSSNRSYMEFDLCRPSTSRPAALNLSLVLEKAELLLGGGNWMPAIDALRPHRDVELARPLLLRALSELADDRTTIDVMTTARSNAEAVVLGGAILGAGSDAEVDAFLSSDVVASSTDASVREIALRVRKKRKS